MKIKQASDKGKEVFCIKGETKATPTMEGSLCGIQF